MSKLFIITGSSGFIGSYIANKLLEEYNHVIGIDIEKSKLEKYDQKYLHVQKDLSNNSNNNEIVEIIKLKMIEWNIGNTYVFHLAGKISVEESMSNPILYYKHNVYSTCNVLEIMKSLSINKIYFSSTAAVYDSSIGEGVFDIDSNIKPSSVYGHSKFISESVINNYVNLYGFKAIIFRFFNVGGGQDSKDAHHLIPKLVSSIINNKDWYVYGKNYNTKDGTCIRDYIHVNDIYIAFMKAINLNKTYSIINLGSGSGYSVLDVIETSKNILLKMFSTYNIPKTIFTDRRAGDPDVLVSDITRTYLNLNWNVNNTIENIIIDTMLSYDMIMD